MRITLFLLLYLSITIVYPQKNGKDLPDILTAGKVDTVSVNRLNSLSQKIMLSNPDSAIKYAQNALFISKDLDYVKGEALALKLMAQGLIYLGKYEEALESTTNALNLYLGIRDELGAADVLRQIGTIKMYTGEYQLAIENYNQSIDLFKNNENLKGQAEAYNGLGNIEQKKGNYPQASEYLHHALALTQKLGDKEGEANALNNIGIIYEYTGDFEKALNNYFKALQIYNELDDQLGLAIGLHNAGIILKRTKKYDSALYNFEQAMAIDMKIGALDGVAYDKKEMGETYLLMERMDTAYIYLHDALLLSKKFNDPVVTVPTLIGLGKIHHAKNRTDSSLFYFITAFDKAKEVELINEQKDAAKSLFELYDQLGNVNEAYKYHKIYYSLKDSLFNDENIRKLAVLEAEYKYNNKRTQEELKNKLNEAERDRELAEAIWLRNTSIIAIVILTLLAIYTYINYRRKMRANAKLNALNAAMLRQKEELTTQAYELAEFNSTLEQKVNQRTKQLENKNLQLEIKNEKLANYAFYNAHKLRAPLASIMGLASLLMNPKVIAQERQDIASKIQDCSNDLNQIIQEMRKLLEDE